MAMDMIDKIISREGGAKVTKDPVDPGGTTKYGISAKSHPGLNIEVLTYEQAKDIYIQEYFVQPGFQQLPVELQEPVTDFGVHSGTATAVRFLQKLCGVSQDGVLGTQTLNALKALPLADVVAAYRRERVLFLAKQVVDVPAKAKYLVGWLNRALSV
jgi:lysozyme family protein